METIKASATDINFPNWKFSIMDLACIDMVIRGTWLFEGQIDVNQLKTSLIKLLCYYPTLTGRIKNGSEIEVSNQGVSFDFIEEKEINLEDVLKFKNPIKRFSNELILSEVKKGISSLLTVKLTHLKDGSVLSVHCAHVCMDGNSFYSMMQNWSKIYCGEAIEAPVFNQSLVPKLGNLTKEEVIHKVEERGWKKVNFSSLFTKIISDIKGLSNIKTEAVFISEDTIQKLKQYIFEKSGNHYSTHVILSAFITKICLQLNNIEKGVQCSQISVVDYRTRIEKTPSNLVGNCVSNVVTPDFSAESKLEDIAEIINRTLKDTISNPDNFMEYILLNFYSMNYKLPYVPFDLKGMGAKKPTCIYINNMSKFPIYDLDFGTGKPTYIIPHDLPDAVKIFPSKQRNGVNIYFGGYLAKHVNKLKNKREWVNNMLKQEGII